LISYYIKEKGSPIQQIDRAQKGCWINIYPPSTQDEFKLLSTELDIPLDYFIDALDVDERSRYEQEDGVQFIVLNIPIKNTVEQAYEPLYITIPIGILEVDDYLITVSAFENPVIDYFLNNNVKKFSTHDHSHLVLSLFDKTVYYYLHYLKIMNNQRNLYEQELYYSSRNQELSKLMNIQKSLVYFVTNLRENEVMLHRMQRTNFLNISHREEQNDFFEDIIIDMSQAREMAQIYTDILNAIMDAFASIISNNMNTIMKRLTSITIILMVPTLVASFYGMNVELWGQNSPYALEIIIFVAVTITISLVLFFRRQRLF